MLKTVWQEQLTRRSLFIWFGIFVFIFGLYVVMDGLGQGSLKTMLSTLGFGVFFLHILINAILALVTSGMVSLSQIKLRLMKVEPKGSTSIPFLSFIFAVFTFGCTPCVVAFMAAVGIAFVPIVFPLGNLLWKIVLLALMLPALFYILYSIDKGTCKVKP